jgi:hypothetical protein
MNLERRLTEALRRQEPPPGLADRVLTHIKAGEPVADRSFWRARSSVLRLAAAFVVMVSIGVGVAREREARRERQLGEFATRQLLTALEIASETLNDAQRIVQRN